MSRNREKYMKNDMILIVILCVCAVVLSAWIYIDWDGKDDALMVEVLVDGELMDSYMLDGIYDSAIDLGTGNSIMISDGVVYMHDADCPDKHCINKGKIDGAGESIICLPHKRVVRIVAGSSEHSEDGLDVMPR